MVLVCHNHPFIFLKTRKTAGTSVEMVLEQLCVPPGTAITEHHPASFTEFGIVGRRGDDYKPRGLKRLMRFREWRNHQSAAFVHRMLGDEAWAAHPRITSVRNPFDRTVSYFYYKLSTMGEQIGDTNFEAVRRRFSEFVRGKRWHDDREIVFLKGRYIIDHAVRFEHMADDLRAIAAKLDLPLDRGSIPVTKSTSGARKTHDVPEYYDQGLVEIVKSRMSWVFDHFDYPLEPQPKYEVTT